jgi:hypothetical protein
MPKTKRPLDPRQKNQASDLDFENAPVIGSFVKSIAYGNDAKGGNEILCVGTRGDGKTIGVLSAMFLHAVEHYAKGYPLPVSWMGVTDTFTSHKLKTVRSLENPLFKGGWRLTDNDHVASYYHQGAKFVHLDLFGIEDQGAMDRLRMETNCMWFEEPAPSAVMVQSSGISLEAWMLGRTSQRLPTHFHAAVATENYPDEDHWTWERWKPSSNIIFAHPEKLRQLLASVGMLPPEQEFLKYPNGVPAPMCIGVNDGRQYYRVPAGERASEEDRLQWARDLKERPDLLRRLILGQPGVVMLGDQVAQGFTKEEFTTKEIKPFLPGQPLILGFDFGHTPTVVIAQPQYGKLRVKAGLFIIGGGMRQLMEELLRPYLARFAPWALRNPLDYLYAGFDPAQGTEEKPKGTEADIESSALQAIKYDLDGINLEPGPILWEHRKDALVKVFQRRDLIIEENQFTIELIRALDGRWYYPKSHTGELRSDKPYKRNAPYHDLGDAFVYMLCRYGVVVDTDIRSSVQVIRNITAGM